MGIQKRDGKWSFQNAKIRKCLPEDIIQPAIDTKDNEDFKEIILTFSLMFNDLKNITIVNDSMMELYSIDKKDLVSGNNGEITGISYYMARLLFGTLHESLQYLKEKRKILESSEFTKLIKDLSADDSMRWKLVCCIAFENEITTDDFRSDFIYQTKDIIDLLKSIRNNVSFHYQTKKRLADGYRNFFYKKEINKSNKFALRSLQKTSFLDTRYYFADGAIEGYFSEIFHEKYSIKEFTNKSLEISALLCSSINSILNIYFEKLPNR